MSKTTINIPYKMMKKFRGEKSSWDLFVFAVCLKFISPSSAIKPTIYNIRKLIGCSNDKAKKLIERAKNNTDLFIYYESANLLIARSFTHNKLEKSEFKRGKKTYTAYHAFCLKLKLDNSEPISHFKLSRQLRDILIKQAMKAAQLKHAFSNVVSTKTKKQIISSRANRSKALNVVKLGRISGYHHSTVSRHIKKMEMSGEVKVFRPDYIKVADIRSEKMLTNNPAILCRKTFVKEGYLVVRDANSYCIDNKAMPECVNIIFNHSKRHNKKSAAKVKNFADAWLDFINR